METKFEVGWDLSPIFTSPEDPKIDETLKLAHSLVLEIELFRGKINSSDMTPVKLKELLDQVGEVSSIYMEVYGYANLVTSVNQENKPGIILRNKAMVALNKTRQKTAFVTIELGDLLADRGEEFLHSPLLSNYKHYLEKVQRAHDYRLSETEEQLIIEKNLYGISEWSKLQQQWLSTRKFVVQGKEVGWSEGRGLFTHNNHAVRREALTTLKGGLKRDQEVYASALRSICGDHVADSKRRGYKDPLEPALVANDISQEMLANMFEVIGANVHLYQRFLKLKARMMGTGDRLRGEDLEAPLPSDNGGSSISWEQTKTWMVDTYGSFDPELGSIVENMFDRNRIDASPRPTKVAGAFCSTWYRGKTTYVLQSFTNTMDDALTLAHELGHAVHGHLASQSQVFLSHRAPMVLAETASEFGRMLFVEKVLSEAKAQTKRNVLFKSLEEIVMAIFEVGTRFHFEADLYATIEQGGYLDGDKITELFQKAREKYFGESIDWLPEQFYQWCWKPHYYMPNFRFYNFPYVFAELIVLALYNSYRQEGEAFVPRYKAFLATGNAKSPEEMVHELGFDLADKKFWEMGFVEIERLLDELEEIERSR